MSGLEKIKQYELNRIKEAQSKRLSSDKRKEYIELYRENDKLKNALFQIVNNSKMETIGMLGREKITINLSSDEWEKLRKWYSDYIICIALKKAKDTYNFFVFEWEVTCKK